MMFGDQKITVEQVICAYRRARDRDGGGDIVDRSMRLGMDRFLGELSSEFRGAAGIKLLKARVPQ